jgi:putative ABC transport system substrate-binding protein
MSRRLVLMVVMSILGLGTLPIWAQQQPRVAVVGFLVPSIPENHPALETLRNRLRELGYVKGQNIKYEYRSAQGELGRLPGLAEELARLKVDVIVAATEPAIWAAKNATTTIPIVMVAYSSDPTASRLVDSFGRPGGNLTGIFTRDSELLGKRLELLKETIPGLSLVTVFWDSYSAQGSAQGERDELKRAAHPLKVQLEFVEIRAPSETSAAFTAARKRKAQAVMILLSPALYVRNARIAQEALANRLPLMGFPHDFTRAGGLITYGTDLRDNYYRVAYFIDELLKGTKPSNLPVEQVAIPKLVVNTKTAKALGIKIPESILVRADEVIR